MGIGRLLKEARQVSKEPVREGRVPVSSDLIDDVLSVIEGQMAQMLVASMREWLVEDLETNLKKAPTSQELQSADEEAFDKALEVGKKEDIQQALDNWEDIVEYLSKRTNRELAGGGPTDPGESRLSQIIEVSDTDWPPEFRDMVEVGDKDANWGRIKITTWFERQGFWGRFGDPDDHNIDYLESPRIQLDVKSIAKQSGEVEFEWVAWFDEETIENRQYTPIPIPESLRLFRNNWESLLSKIRGTVRHEIIHWMDHSLPDYVLNAVDPDAVSREEIEQLADGEQHSALDVEYWTDLESFLSRVERDVERFGEITRDIWKVWLGGRSPLPDQLMQQYEEFRSPNSMVSRKNNHPMPFFSAQQKISQNRYRKAVRLATSVAERNGWLASSPTNLPENRVHESQSDVRYIDVWYDSQGFDSWAVQRKTEDEFQVGDVEYRHSKEDAKKQAMDWKGPGITVRIYGRDGQFLRKVE